MYENFQKSLTTATIIITSCMLLFIISWFAFHHDFLDITKVCFRLEIDGLNEFKNFFLHVSERNIAILNFCLYLNTSIEKLEERPRFRQIENLRRAPCIFSDISDKPRNRHVSCCAEADMQVLASNRNLPIK